MSIRREKVLSLAEINHENKSQDELSVLFKKVLKKGQDFLGLVPRINVLSIAVISRI